MQLLFACGAGISPQYFGSAAVFDILDGGIARFVMVVEAKPHRIVTRCWLPRFQFKQVSRSD